MDPVFTFLFKYRPAAFARGDFGFAPPGPWWLALLAAVAAVVVALLFYLRSPRLRPRDRVILASLRLAALAVLVVCLAGPVLLVATAVPRRNVIAVVVDASRSMGIEDADLRPRLAAALAELGTSGGTHRALADRFQVRAFSFADELAPLADSLAPRGRATDLAMALDGVHDRLAGQALAGVVLATDGADGSGRLEESIRRYRDAGIPVHVLAMGDETLTRDVAVDVPGLPTRALTGGSLVADVRVSARGYRGRPAVLTVEDEGAIVARAEVTLPEDGATTVVPVRFTLANNGPRRIRVRVAPLDGEAVRENNSRENLVIVDRGPRRVLYFEGEPRFEIKFLRRAIAADSQLRVVTLLRTADQRFLRLDVADSTELSGGFPTRREDLFGYDAILLGSAEAAFFTRDQLTMLAEFVRVRGGGLLALGGRHAFEVGGFAATPLADALPIQLPAVVDSAFHREVRVARTTEGRRHPVLRLLPDESANDTRWDSLPPLTLLHPIRSVKPGATALLTGEAEGGPYVVLASQRYGRGLSAAFTIHDSWLWQMDAALPADDQTHETLWRQLLRWLTSDAHGPVRVLVEAATPAAGKPVTITAEVADSAWQALSGGDVIATVTRPDGEEVPLALPWVAGEDGRYRASYTPAADGVYGIVVDVQHNERRLGSARTWLSVGDPAAEFAQPGRQTALLRRLAEETGGRFYTTATIAGLPEDVRYTTAGAITRERLDLWDMPILLIALLALLGAEWSYRRARGLA